MTLQQIYGTPKEIAAIATALVMNGMSFRVDLADDGAWFSCDGNAEKMMKVIYDFIMPDPKTCPASDSIP